VLVSYTVLSLVGIAVHGTERCRYRLLMLSVPATLLLVCMPGQPFVLVWCCYIWVSQIE